MITPTSITNYNRTEAELEEFLMFAILVAGKSAEQQAKKLDAFLNHSMYEYVGMPFDHVAFLNHWGFLDIQMKEFKLGQYKRVGHAFREILQFKNRLKKISVEELESVKGIGSKTARFFVLHSRPNQKVAVLDTHILKYLRHMGHDVPKATPSKNKYKKIENIFLKIAEDMEMSVADLDLHIWKTYAQKA